MLRSSVLKVGRETQRKDLGRRDPLPAWTRCLGRRAQWRLCGWRDALRLQLRLENYTFDTILFDETTRLPCP